MAELFVKTDIISHMEYFETHTRGGESAYSDNIVGFFSDGVHEVRDNRGRMIEYCAHVRVSYCHGYDPDAAHYIYYYDKALELSDAKSTDISDFDINWYNENVSQALQKIVSVTIGLDTIKKFTFGSVDSFEIPKEVKTIGSNAFSDCPALKKVILMGENTRISNNGIPKTVTIAAPKGSPSEKYALQNGNPFEELNEDIPQFFVTYNDKIVYYSFALKDLSTHSGEKQTDQAFVPDSLYNTNYKDIKELTPYNVPIGTVRSKFANDDEVAILDRFMVLPQVKVIRTGAFPCGKEIFIPNNNTKIEPGAISKELHIITLGHGAVNEYAKQNGNEITVISEELPKDNPLGFKINNKVFYYSFPVSFKIMGLSKKELEAISNGEKIDIVHAPEGHLNSMRVEFRSAESGTLYGLMNINIGNNVAYHMDRGNISFSNAHIENGSVKADFDLRLPISDYLYRRLVYLLIYETRIIPILNEHGFEVSDFDYGTLSQDIYEYADNYLYWIIKDLVKTDKADKSSFAARISEPGNKISMLFSNYMYHFAAFVKDKNGDYSMLEGLKYLDFKAALTVKDNKIFYADSGKELVGNELDFAKIYIDHYRKLKGTAENTAANKKLIKSEFGMTFAEYLKRYNEFFK